MDNDSDRFKHIFSEFKNLYTTIFYRNNLEILYELSPFNSILIEINNCNKVIDEIRNYLCHISPVYRLRYLDFEPDSIYMIF